MLMLTFPSFFDLQLEYLSSLPSKIRQFMEKEDWSKAIDAYVKAKAFFEKYRNVPSFRDIDKECTELINDVVRNMEDSLNSAVWFFIILPCESL